MPLIYKYKNNQPLAKIRLKILDREGDEKIIGPIDVLVDTGASTTTLPKSLFENLTWFAETKIDGTAAGEKVQFDAVILSGKIELLSDKGEVFDVIGFEDFTIVLRETKLLGLDIINNHIYEFNGRRKILKINHHSN